VRPDRLAVSLVFFLHGLASGTWVSRIPAVQETLGLSVGTLGIALLGAGLGSLLAMIPVGALIARRGSRAVVYWTALPAYGSLGLLALVWDATSLFGALLIFGGAYGALDVAMNAQGSFLEERLGRPVMSSLHGLWSLGNMAGAAFGVLLAAVEIGARSHFLVAGPILLIALLVAARRLPEGDGGGVGPAFARPRGALLALAAVAFGAVAVEGAMFDWSGVYLRSALGTPEATAAAAPSFFSLAMAAGRLGGDRLTARFSAPLLARLCALLASIGVGAIILAQVPAAVFAGLVAVGLGLSVLVPLAFGAAGRSPDMPAGAAIAAVATVSYFAFLAGPPTIGLIAEQITLRGAFLLLLGLLAAVALLAPTLGTPRRRA
jgi:MFS family permease